MHDLVKQAVVRTAEDSEILQAFASAAGIDSVVNVKLLVIPVAQLAPISGPR
jgi:hypothetical protein